MKKQSLLRIQNLKWPLIISLLLCNVQFYAIGQGRNLIFDHYTTAGGLSDNGCTSIIQDDDGFTWIGTNNGLDRFDGKDFVEYYADGSSHQLPGNLINKIICLPGRRLAVATNNGLAVLNTKMGAVRQIIVSAPDELKTVTNEVVDMVLDKKGNLILGTTGGVYILNADLQLVFRYDAYTPKDIGNTRLLFLAGHSLSLLPDGKVVIRGNFGFMYVLNTEKKILQNLRDVAGNEFDLLKPWYGTGVVWGSNGLGQFFFIKDVPFPQPSVDSIFIVDLPHKTTSVAPLPFSAQQKINWESTFNVVNDNILSISTQGHQGIYLFKFNPKTLAINFIQQALPQTFCTEIVSDKNGRIWVATDQGVFKQSFNKAAFNILFPPTLTSSIGDDKTINNIIQYQNKYFVSEYGVGILVYDSNLHFVKSINFDKLGKGNWPWHIGLYSKDTLLIANGRGALLLNTLNFMLKNFWQPRMPKVIDSFTITTSFIDSHRQLWMGVGSGNGVFKMDLNTHQWEYFSSKSPKAIFKLRYPQSVAEDSTGNVWMGSHEGITRWNPRKRTFDTLVRRLPGRAENSALESSITVDSANNLWILIPDLLLVKWNLNSQKVTYFSRPDNIPPLRAEFLAGPWENRLWMRTTKGLLCFNIVTEHFTLITKSDGLYDDNVTGNLDFDSASNRLFVGFTDAFTWFRPTDVLTEKKPIEAIITDVRNIGDSVSLAGDSSVSLSYTNNSFVISFTGINYNDGEKNTYEYRLFTGKPGAFINVGQQKSITFASLNPGHYTFQVKAILSDGTESLTATTLYITIAFPFYETWWFYLLCAIMVASALNALYRYRINQFLKLQQVRNRIASDLHDDIGSSLSGISIMSVLAKAKSPEAISLLDSIEKNATVIQENMSDIVWAINPNNDNFQNVLQRMNQFAAELLEIKNIDFVFSVVDTLSPLKLSMGQRKNLYLFFKEAINNAVKYSGAKTVTVNIIHQNNFVIMNIRDDGKGFDTATSYRGNGMNTMRKRAEEMNGDVKIISLLNAGTTIELKFKIT